MNRVDGVILGVGVVVLVASIIGVILYDDTTGPEFEVTWAQSSQQQLSEMTDSGGAGEYTFEVPINAAGIAEATFSVDVTRNGAASGESVEVSVEGPSGQTGSCTFELPAPPAGSGTCEATADVQEAPAETTLSAETAGEAEAEAEEGLETTGSGTWTVTVTIQAGTSLPGPGSPQYTIGVTPGYTVWEANAQAPTPGGRGGP